MTIGTGERIATLDIVRGVAVMGILAMNIVAFADVPAAYFNPLAQTVAVRTGDLLAYAGNFLLFDGKMRGLFSFLFGASLLLMSETMALGRVRRRLFWLLLFGAAHFFLIWWGDILITYAAIGFLALAFRSASPRALIVTAVILVAVQFAIFAAMTFYSFDLQGPVFAGTATPEQLKSWEELTRDTIMPSTARRAEAIALYRGPWTALVHHQVTEKAIFPVVGIFAFGWETLAYMLLGMAALKTGLLTGAWDNRRLLKWALICLAVALPVYLVALRFLFRSEWAASAVFMWAFAAAAPVRPLMVTAFACLIILATRNGGPLVERIAAAGRAAFSNYLGTSIVMTGIFYGWGLGLYASLGRVELLLVVIAAWAVMLLWSKPWLERFRYGPLEWAWRSLTNWRVEPLRRLDRA
ncbi:DUF418 domain-containing protein [Sphingomonas glaciei]|uniref:DUF418 domain-containing protein n=1 Tax=Sphingomonas glaciei TaxID=2938948 RepID=A0ABY5MWN9_9SPHN|nr:DUF418 domain-containing protein [Sphingomonas glaciei]UUR06796.1 DUF418 domain-containing protein [Sphingomonas glaciei]